MCKCGWCKHSYREDGKLQCPHYRCQLSQADIFVILEKIFAKGGNISNG
jgi:hypothetical protein